MIKEFNILTAGAGGQGVILVSDLLGRAAVADGLKVRGSEIIGMAMRGGSVVSIIRLGDEVYGAVIPEGRGDLMIGMEVAETLRNIIYMSKSGWIVLNKQRIVPPMVLLGKSVYPRTEEVVEKLRSYVEKVIEVDAIPLAEKAGSFLSANIVMLGASFGTGRLPIKVETIKEIIRRHFPAKAVSININAFDLGYEACRQVIG